MEMKIHIYSEAGIYIFSDSANNNMSNIKVVGYGTSSSAYKKFVDEYQNPNEFGWKEFWDTYQGKHLLSYLKDTKGYDYQISKGLKYQEIIYYWKEYVSAVIDENIKYRPDYSNEENPDNTLNDIFKNFPNEINIFNSNLEENIENVKQSILDKVLHEYEKNCDLNYEYDKDWKIEYPSNENLLKLAKIEYENINPNPFKTTIKLYSVKENLIGNKVVSIKNTGSKKPNIPNNDLSQIEVRDYEYQFDSSIELKKQFIYDLTQDLNNDYNLLYGEFVEIQNIDQKLKSLFYTIGTHSVYLKLIPLDEGIKGYKQIKLTKQLLKLKALI